MGDREGKFEYAGQVGSEQAAEYLERIAAGLRLGRVGLGAGAKRTALATGELLKLEIEAESKDGKGSLAFELSWRPADEPAPVLEILSNGDEQPADELEVDEEEVEIGERREKPKSRRT